MAGAPNQLTGSCLCGAVKYRTSGEPLVQAVCHCADCQRQSGTAFSVVVGVQRDALTLEGNTLASFTTVNSDHGTDTERHFCSACGSPIVSFSAALPEMAFLKAGTLDDGSWLQPSVEVWASSAQPWAPHFEHAASFERGPS